MPCPDCFTPAEETRYQLYRRLGEGPRADLDWCEKISPSSGFEPRTIQPVVSRCTNLSYACPRNGLCSNHDTRKLKTVHKPDITLVWVSLTVAKP